MLVLRCGLRHLGGTSLWQKVCLILIPPKLLLMSNYCKKIDGLYLPVDGSRLISFIRKFLPRLVGGVLDHPRDARELSLPECALSGYCSFELLDVFQ
ncbi:MAG: hypothetical protein DLM55_08465 [Acidimicrobiales bacterium]|nr:MAG: hypothetical protein DLM55_08465 [Acidimicrobiales bacterium]